MKVGLDVSKMHKLSKDRGIGYYAQNLYGALKKYTDVEVELLENQQSYDRFDLIHFPFFDLFKHTLPSEITKPFVVTIPDLIPVQFSKHYPSGLKGKFNFWRQKQSLKKSRAIITISETIKKDIQRILKIDSSKVHSIHLAASEKYRKITSQNQLTKAKEKYKLPEEFVLYIGNVNWNKNILNMTEACIRSGRNLVIIGSSFLDKNNLDHPEKRSQKEFLKRYENSNLIKMLGFVPDEDLVLVMNLATCFIFVSYYEGFGLPILEAQSCGVPVITSNISATAEISGPAAILVRPDKPEEITNAINKLFASPELRVKYTRLGLENVRKFSWEKTAKQTTQVYNEVLS